MNVVYKKLEDVCEILDSRRVPITAKDRKAGDYPYYGANGLQDYVADYIFDDELVLLAEDGGNFGSKERPIAYRVSGKCWVNNHAHVLKAKPNMHVDYLCYALMFYDTEGLVNGATRQKLTQAAMRQMVIPYRNMAEQLQIIEKISQIVGSIKKRKEELQLLDQLVKSRFIELFGTIHDNRFGFSVVTLQDVSAPIKDGTHQTPTYTTDVENGYKFLSSKDVTTGKVDWSHLKYIPEELHRELYARISPRKGDILLAKNGTTGIAAIVDRDEVFDIYVSLALIRPLGVDPTYLWAAINAAETKQQFDASLKGIGVPNLHLGEIKKARIILPPMELQEQFATFVEQTDKSKYYKSIQILKLITEAIAKEVSHDRIR